MNHEFSGALLPLWAGLKTENENCKEVPRVCCDITLLYVAHSLSKPFFLIDGCIHAYYTRFWAETAWEMVFMYFFEMVLLLCPVMLLQADVCLSSFPEGFRGLSCNICSSSSLFFFLRRTCCCQELSSCCTHIFLKLCKELLFICTLALVQSSSLHSCRICV